MIKGLVAGVATAMLLAGCGSAVTIDVPPGATTTTSSSGASTTGSEPTTQTVPGMPASVRTRLDDSGVYELVAETKELTWQQTSDVVVVGNSPTWVHDVAQAAQRRAAPLAKLIGQDPATTYLFLVPGNDATAKDWDAGDTTTRDFDGVTLPGFTVSSPNYIIIMAQHTFDDGTSIASDPGYIDSLVQHEMFHAATLTGDAGTGDTPEWVIEGFAEWAGQNVTASKPSRLPPIRLPDDEEVLDEKDYGYFRSFMFVDYLVHTYGREKAMAFYRADVDPDAQLTTVFEETFAVPFATAEAAWKRQFTDQYDNYDADYEYD